MFTVETTSFRNPPEAGRHYAVRDAAGAIVGTITDTEMPIYGRIQGPIELTPLWHALRATGSKMWWCNLSAAKAEIEALGAAEKAAA